MKQNLIGRRAFLGLGVAGGLAAFLSGKYAFKAQDREPTADELKRTVLDYLAQPQFSSRDFMKQITDTDAEMQIFDLDEDRVYLSLPMKGLTEGNLRDTLFKLSLNPEDIRYGKTPSGEVFSARGSGEALYLGDYALRIPETFFLSFPSGDFNVGSDKVIKVPFSRAEYTQSLRELCNFVRNASIYGGKLYFSLGSDEGIGQVTGANHGAFVGKKGEPSLDRLVKDLTCGSKSTEEKAQRVLDFVTEEIKYNPSEANAKAETLKRPNEVLMTGNSDCSGKTILLASLLEQLGIDYRLLYINRPLTDSRHISVAVEGNYPDRNGLCFELNGKKYHAAEATTRGFQIGRTRLASPWSMEDIDAIQRPKKDAKVYSTKTGKVLNIN